MANPLIDSLRRAVEATPADITLRLHLAELELADGQRDAAIVTISAVLAMEPMNQDAAALMMRAIGQGDVPVVPPTPTTAPSAPPTPSVVSPSGPVTPPPPPMMSNSLGPPKPEPRSDNGFDWAAAEGELDFHPGPAFVDANPDTKNGHDIFSSERPSITLADVGGLEQVKKRLNVAFLAPLQNQELRALYSKSLRGGLLMYGPPGCGKTYIARAVAGELGASFLPLGVTQILDRWLGESERNIHEFFQQARRDAPCVIFLDELDTLGQRRSTSNVSMVSVVNQLLTELDGVDHSNEGVFALAATNQPWQVDPALRRPGRFDRTMLVLPPDAPAREAIFRHHLKTRPIENIDVRKLAAATQGYTGADIALICESATEIALMESIESGQVRMITMADLMAALTDIRPSISPWLETARNIVTFGEDDGTFGELRAYLKKVKRL